MASINDALGLMCQAGFANPQAIPQALNGFAFTLRTFTDQFVSIEEKSTFSQGVEVKFQMERLPQTEGRRNFEEMQQLKRSGELDRLKPQKTRQRKKLSDLAVEEAGALEVKHMYAGIARAGGKIRYLDSGGIGPCIVVTLYDKKTKTGAMLHFLTQVFDAADNLNRAFAYLREHGVDIKNLEVRIIGGDNHSDNSKYLFYKLHRFLCDTLGEENIVETDVFSEHMECVFLDLTDGELYDTSMPEALRQKAAIKAFAGVAPPDGQAGVLLHQPAASKPRHIVPKKEDVFEMIPNGKGKDEVKEAIWEQVRARGSFLSEGELEGFVRGVFDSRRAIASQP